MRVKIHFVAIVVLLLCLLLDIAEARTRHYRWEIAYQLKSPDCFQKLAVTINGQSPGPIIRAEQGDLIIVEVKNMLFTDNTAIHWHGIRQIGTPWSDGIGGVTQCPILPGETFVYKFVVDRQGTYIYHAHYGMQRVAGLYGSIIVSPPTGVAEPFAYDYDANILLSDWWHKSAQEQSAGLNSVPFIWINEPQSLLINGRGRFDCKLAGSSDVCNATSPECSPYVRRVIPGKTYRLRIGSITALSALNLEIEVSPIAITQLQIGSKLAKSLNPDYIMQGHNLTVVEADGHYVDPFIVKNLNIYSGETYSVLLTADRDPTRNYWIAVNVVSRNSTTIPTGVGILNYYPVHSRKPPLSAPPTGPHWNDVGYRFNQSLLARARPGYVSPPPATSDRLIILLNTQNKINDHIRWSINNVSFTKPRTPYLIALKLGLNGSFSHMPPPETYDYKSYDIQKAPPNPNATYSDAPYRLRFNSTVDVVLQNAAKLDNLTSETHPWHLHGHDFWVLAYGMGKFDPASDPKRFNLVDPIMKNTVAVHPFGWTAIRFRADNPGVWMFHCHIASHLDLGMWLVFEEGVERVRPLPRQIMGCGQTRGLIRRG